MQDKIDIFPGDIELVTKSERWQELSAAEGVASDVKGASSVDVAGLGARPLLDVKKIDIERLTTLTSEDIIDRFLRSDNHRIVASDSEEVNDIEIEAELGDVDDMVSEELAEVYLAQGLNDMAIATYRKLSLLNPKKSIYFARLIEKIESIN